MKRRNDLLQLLASTFSAGLLIALILPVTTALLLCGGIMLLSLALGR